jgi:hypothetical protein
LQAFFSGFFYFFVRVKGLCPVFFLMSMIPESILERVKAYATQPPSPRQASRMRAELAEMGYDLDVLIEFFQRSNPDQEAAFDAQAAWERLRPRLK